MNCSEAKTDVLALYDGEQIPPNAAQHIAACQACHQILDDYSRMGAELRLAATMELVQLPPLKLPPRARLFDFLWRRVSLPRYALAALIACLVLATAAVSLVRAQSRSLWFQFGYGLHETDEVFHYTVAKPGYEHTQATLSFLNGIPVAAALRGEGRKRVGRRRRSSLQSRARQNGNQLHWSEASGRTRRRSVAGWYSNGSLQAGRLSLRFRLRGEARST